MRAMCVQWCDARSSDANDWLGNFAILAIGVYELDLSK
jgi:hypothetical protein